MKKKVTIKDIARAAGVSHPVVSAVLKNKKSTIKFSEDTRQRIRKIAKELNYKPNILARSFQRQQSFLVGVLFSGVNQAMASDFLHGLQRTLSSKSYSPVTFIHSNCEEELEYLERCVEREVEGLIVNAAIDDEGRSNGEELSRLAERIPMIEVFGNEIFKVPSLRLDYYTASLKATRKLIEEGHKSIALFLHDRYMLHAKYPGLYHLAWQYLQGYRDAIQEGGLQELVVTHPILGDPGESGSTFTGAYQHTLEILDHPSKPTAILCHSREEVDAIVMTMVAQGRSFSQDFHLVSPGSPGYTKTGLCRTTMLVPPVQDIGERAAASLFDLIDGKKIESMKFAFRLEI